MTAALMDGSGTAEPRPPAAEEQSAPATPTQGSDVSAQKTRPKTAERVDAHDFANPTLNIIHSFSRSTSASTLPSREGTPPPLPPRPQLGVPPSRPSTAHSSAPSRPQLLSKATTQVSVVNTQAWGNESRDDSSVSPASKQRTFLDANLPAHTASDADDSASIRSYAPTTDAGGDAESILGDVMGPQEKTEQELLLLRTLGHRFVDTEAQSMFPVDPWLESAFEREFDEVDELNPDGSNEG